MRRPQVRLMAPSCLPHVPFEEDPKLHNTYENTRLMIIKLPRQHDLGFGKLCFKKCQSRLKVHIESVVTCSEGAFFPTD